VFALLATIVVTVAVCIAVIGLSTAAVAPARTLTVLAAAASFLAFFLAPMLTGTADQLDPRRFGPFGVDEKRMPWILALASLVSVPSFALIAVNVCFVIMAVAVGGVAWPVAVVAAVVAVVSTALIARIGMAISVIALPERRSRELTVLFTIPLIVVAFPVAAYFASLKWDGQVPESVATAATVVGFSPLAAPQAFLFHLAEGDARAAWTSGLIALASLALLLALWAYLVRRLLTTTERPYATRERSGLGWFGSLPANAFGAVAARSLVYWLRDRRYIVNIIVVPIAGVLTVFPLMVAGVPPWAAALVPVPLMALFFGWLPHNDVAYDSTALWIHVASGVRGLPDRLGRLVPVLLVAIPVLAVAVSVTLAYIGNWSLLLPLIGVAAALLLTGLGMSSIASVVAPYAVSRPGDSPFQQPQRSSSHGSFGAAGTFVGALIFSAPALWLFVLTVVQGDQHAPSAFWTGIVTGVLVLFGGAAIGGAIFERNGARLMEFVETT
jgi:ABC-2 type transport system permease protein